MISPGSDCQLEQLRGAVSRALGGEVHPRTFTRWRSCLGWVKGRGAFYTPEEAAVLIEFGRLVQLGISYEQAHEVIFEKYGSNDHGH